MPYAAAGHARPAPAGYATQPAVSADAAAFADDWYLVKRGIVDADRRSFLHDYALARDRGALMPRGDDQVASASYAYSDPQVDRLLEDVREAVEQASGFDLWPTFSYMRVYRTGNILRAHRDRPACEISMTVNLGPVDGEPWPIWIGGPNGVAAVALKPGDGLIYRGCDCYHWREPFAGDHQVQAFLHYVDRHGTRAEWKFDKRPRLSWPVSWPVGGDAAAEPAG